MLSFQVFASESEQSSWSQLFCSCICVSVLFSFLSWPSKTSRTKTCRTRWPMQSFFSLYLSVAFSDSLNKNMQRVSFSSGLFHLALYLPCSSKLLQIARFSRLISTVLSTHSFHSFIHSSTNRYGGSFFISAITNNSAMNMGRQTYPWDLDFNFLGNRPGSEVVWYKIIFHFWEVLKLFSQTVQ